MEFVDLKSNIAFKRVFGNEQHKDILINFLNAVLELSDNKRIKEVVLKKLFEFPVIETLKHTTVLDAYVLDSSGVKYIVRIHIEKKLPHSSNYFIAPYYRAESYCKKAEVLECIAKINQVIFIGIIDFNIFDGKEYLTQNLILKDDNLCKDLDNPKFYFIELQKFDKNESDVLTIIEEWVYLIKNSGNLLTIPKRAEKIAELKEAYTLAAICNWCQDDLDIYDYWEIRDADYSTLKALRSSHIGSLTPEIPGNRYVLEAEHVKGKIERNFEIARKMLQKCMAIEDIIEITGLTQDDIEAI